MTFVRLRDMREDADLTQSQVGALLGIDQRVYSTYETGKRLIPITHVVALAQQYDVNVDYLLGLTDDRRPYRSRQS